jgi:hypothetical protein
MLTAPAATSKSILDCTGEKLSPITRIVTVRSSQNAISREVFSFRKQASISSGIRSLA